MIGVQWSESDFDGSAVQMIKNVYFYNADKYHADCDLKTMI